MMNFADISFANTFLPLGALMALVLLLPIVTVPRATRSQARLAGGIVLTAGITLIAAALLFAMLYTGEDGMRMGTVLAPALMSALIWGPLLALVWFVRAQAVEKRRGEDMARREIGE